MSAQDSGVHSFNKCVVRTWWVAVATRVGGVLSSTSQIWQLGTRTGSGGSWSWWHAHAWLWGPALGFCIVGQALQIYTVVGARTSKGLKANCLFTGNHGIPGYQHALLLL